MILPAFRLIDKEKYLPYLSHYWVAIYAKYPANESIIVYDNDCKTISYFRVNFHAYSFETSRSNDYN